ncbi:hypothetical protein D3C78_1256720 [compost metagenome]
MTAYSGEPVSRIDSLFSSSSMRLRAWSGNVLPSRRARNSSASALLSSLVMPSSCWMSFNCSCRKNSRWRSPILRLTSADSSFCRRATSTSLRSSGRTFSMRLRIGTQSSTSCSSAPGAVVSAAAKSVSGDGSLGLKRFR